MFSRTRVKWCLAFFFLLSLLYSFIFQNAFLSAALGGDVNYVYKTEDTMNKTLPPPPLLSSAPLLTSSSSSRGRWESREVMKVLREGGSRFTSHRKSEKNGFTTELLFSSVPAKLSNGITGCVGELRIRRVDGSICSRAEAKQFAPNTNVADWIRRSFGPDYFRVLLRGPEVVMGNTTVHRHNDTAPCPTYISSFSLTRAGTYRVYAELVFENYDAVNEMQEKTWYDYRQTQLFDPLPEVECPGPLPQPDLVGQSFCLPSTEDASTQSQQWGRWVAIGKDTSDFKKQYPNYWLHMGKREQPVNDRTPDLLGRMDFGTRYDWHPYGCRHKTYGREAILSLLRNRAIYFFGDSHMRMTFYGLLARLNIKFAHDKVWKGDRTDRVPSHNATISYVASYFMNTSRDTAVDMLRRNDGIVIAGVGQHHASGCWSIAKHASAVEAAMHDFHRYKTNVLWFGVPAHPMNRHMRVVQHRTDCRNNLRHRLLNKVQYELARLRKYPIVDVFAKSWPMIHTSPDGAHYYTWVRDAWLDDIFAGVELLTQKK